MRWLAVILGVGLLIRVGLCVRQPATFETLPDQREYVEAGRSLLAGSGLGFYDPRFVQTVRAYRLPGYPALIAACGGRPAIVRLVQIAVDLSTIIAVCWIGLAVTGRAAVGRLSAAVVAVDPFLAYFSSLILTETLFTAAVTWAIWAIARRRWWMAIVLIVFGASLRPTMFILAPLMAMAANPAFPRPYRVTSAVGRASVAVMICFFVLTPWAARNRVVVGHYLWGTTNDGITLYDGFHQGADGSSDQRFLNKFPEAASMNEYDRSDFFAGQAIRWIQGHPRDAIALAGWKLCRGWSPVPLSTTFSTTASFIVTLHFSVALFVLAVIGFIGSSMSRPNKLLLVSVVLGVSIAQAVSVGSIRYRMPAEPALAVLAAAGWMWKWDRWRAKG